jgi:hypothetical protein
MPEFQDGKTIYTEFMVKDEYSFEPFNKCLTMEGSLENS